MNFDTDKMIKSLNTAAKVLGTPKSNPQSKRLLPPDDATAARVLYAIANAIRAATEDTQTAK